MTDKNTILERLSRRDAQRLEKIQKAHKGRDDDVDVSENEEYFSANFKIKSGNIEEMLAQIPTLETNNLPPLFDTLKKDIADLQMYVVNSALFLKEFNMRKYLGKVQNLQSKIYEFEDKYMPRKKFGFGTKKVPKSESHKPKPLDEADSSKTIDSSKWETELFGFDGKENEILKLETVEQRDVTLRNLKNCTVVIKGVLGTLHITDLENCLILSGPVTTSIFLEKCNSCRVVVACQQLRMHSSNKCDIYLHVTCKGIVEDCSDIRTAPYNFDYEGLDQHFKAANLDRNINNYQCLDDFNWLVPDIPSPNWSVLEESKRQTKWNDLSTKLPS